MIRVQSLIIWFVCFSLPQLAIAQIAYVDVTGPVTAKINEVKDYTATFKTVSGGYVAPPAGDYHWYIYGGEVLSSTSTTCNLIWVTGSSSNGVDYEMITFDNYYSDAIIVNVSGTVAPPTPTATITITNNCGSTLVTRSSPPSGANYDVYWQTSSTGTSTTLGTGSSITRTTAGNLYLRARLKLSPYTWSTGSQLAGNISIVSSPPAVPTTATNFHIIENDPVAVTVSVNPVSNATSYRWYTQSSGGTYPSTQSNSYSPTINQSITYYVESVNGNCASTSRKTVSAYKYPEPVITNTGNNNITIGEQETFSINNFSYDSYQWTNKGVDLPGATLSSYTTSKAGTYNVRVAKGTSQPVTVAQNLNITKGAEGQNLSEIFKITYTKIHYF